MADFPRVPFPEATEALRRRGLNLFASDRWGSVWQEQHHCGFTVARSAGFDILKDIYDATLRVRAEGRTFKEFAAGLEPILRQKGWWGRKDVLDPDTGEVTTVQLGSPRRLRTIFDVNMRVSHAQGRWEQQQKVKGAFPYLRYVGILDSRIRPLHRRWHNTILPMDHAWWKTHYPPNGWKCRCNAVSVSGDDLQRFGWRVSDTPPDDGFVPWVNPATGEVISVPAGIDPGWAYNPGNTDRAAQLARQAMDKLVSLPPAVGAEAVATLAFAFPQVERELGNWLEDIARAVMEDKQVLVTKERRVVGALGNDVLSWLAAHAGVTPETAAITISDKGVMHLVRDAKRKRGNALRLEDVRRLPSLLMHPDAVYWDQGVSVGQTRDPALVYIWDTGERGAGKIVVAINLTARVYDAARKERTSLTVNSVQSGRLDIDAGRALLETSGYIKIKGNL